jgi:hypothetical protein
MSYARFVSAMGVLLVAGVLVTPVFGQEAAPPPVSHDIQGRDNCLMCHTPGAMEAVPDAPASHEGRVSETCLWCHATDSPMLTTSPKAVSHGVQGREQWLMCHTPGAMEAIPDAPASHEGRDVKYCTLCHTG